MATFEEFRATFPEDSHVKGERFEIFLCEWFLKTHTTYKSLFTEDWTTIQGKLVSAMIQLSDSLLPQLKSLSVGN